MNPLLHAVIGTIRRKRTRARFFVRNPGEVQRLLRLLAKLHDGTALSSPHMDTA